MEERRMGKSWRLYWSDDMGEQDQLTCCGNNNESKSKEEIAPMVAYVKSQGRYLGVNVDGVSK